MSSAWPPARPAGIRSLEPCAEGFGAASLRNYPEYSFVFLDFIIKEPGSDRDESERTGSDRDESERTGSDRGESERTGSDRNKPDSERSVPERRGGSGEEGAEGTARAASLARLFRPLRCETVRRRRERLARFARTAGRRRRGESVSWLALLAPPIGNGNDYILFAADVKEKTGFYGLTDEEGRI